MTRGAAVVLALACCLSAVQCGRYGPPRRSRPPAETQRPAPPAIPENPADPRDDERRNPAP